MSRSRTRYLDRGNGSADRGIPACRTRTHSAHWSRSAPRFFARESWREFCDDVVGRPASGGRLNELDPRNRRALDPAQGLGPGTEDEELRRTAIGSSGPPIRDVGTDQLGEIPELEVEPDPESLTETSGEYLDPTILDDGRFGPTDPMVPMFEDPAATLVKTTV